MVALWPPENDKSHEAFPPPGTVDYWPAGPADYPYLGHTALETAGWDETYISALGAAKKGMAIAYYSKLCPRRYGFAYRVLTGGMALCKVWLSGHVLYNEPRG